MGRRHLYHTEEEKAKARKTKAKSYYVANHINICRRSRLQYKKKVDAIKKEKLRKILEGPDDDSEIRDNPLTIIANAREQVDRVTNGAIYTYVDKLVLRCLENPEEAVQLCAFRKDWWRELMEQVQEALREIQQEHGCGDVYKEADLVGKDIHHAVTLIEEIHTHVVTSLDEMEDWRSSGIFSYQICAEGAEVSI